MKKLSAKMIASAHHLRKKGHGYKALAKMLHLSPSTIYKYSKEISLSDAAKSNLSTRQFERQQRFVKKYARKRKIFLSEELAEFVGALLGDGCLSKYFAKSQGSYRYEIAFTGSKTDFPYYRDFLQPVFRKHFGFKGQLYPRKDGSTRFHIRSKRAYNFFLGLGVETGKKTPNLEIPDKIIRSNRLSLACIRGVSNTDGSIFLKGKKREYLAFQLHMNALALLKQTKEVLERNGIFTGRLLKGDCNAHRLCINRQESISKFLALVGFFNKHHLDRLRSFNTSATL